MGETTAFKHHFGPKLACRLAAELAEAQPGFDGDGLVQEVEAGVGPLELKARVALIAEAIAARLPADYGEALAIWLRTLPPPLVGFKGIFEHGFHLYPLSHFIETRGLDDPAHSLDALHALTQRFTGEFAIRPLLREHPEPTLERLRAWRSDPSEHVRRLVSEGSRPHLPWATRLDLPLETSLALLEPLRADASDYVRRSVANHLNDLCRAHPEPVLDTLEAWSRAGSPETAHVIRHALRKLLKQGHPRALALQGYRAPEVELTRFTLDQTTPEIGDSITAEAELRNPLDQPQPLMIDLAVTFLTRTGKARDQVFKLTTTELAPGASATVRKRLDLVPRTTRALYPGAHAVALQVNGQRLAELAFQLQPARG